MSRNALSIGALLSAPALAAGPVTNLDGKAIDRDYYSSANMFDAERCLMNLEGAIMPIAYRQPDRPDTVMLVYSADQSGRGAMRIDLTRTNRGLHVVARTKFKQVLDCAPPVDSPKP